MNTHSIFPFRPEDFELALSGRIIFAVIFLIGLVIFIRRVVYLIQMVKKGQPEDRFDKPGKRILNVIKFVFGQRRLLNLPYIGSAHFVIFWGFVVLSFGTLSFFGKGVTDGFKLLIIETLFEAPFLILIDIFSGLVIIALIMGTLRRLFAKPEKLAVHAEGYVLLGLIFLLVISDLIADGSLIAMTGIEEAKWMPLGTVIASIIGYGNGSPLLYWVMFWTHLVSFWLLAVFVLNSKHLHVFSAPFNVYFSSLKPRGELTKMDLEDEESSFGTGKIEDYTWKQLFDTYSCTECGRCSRACPAYNSQKPLSPRDVITNLRDHFLTFKPNDFISGNGGNDDETDRPLVPKVIDSEVIWSCTTCLACMEECPVFIEHVPAIMDMRRYQMLSEGLAPPEVAPSLRNIEQRQNPFGTPPNERADWAEGLDIKLLAEDSDVEYLLWVGCSGAFDDRNKKVLVALSKLLKKAGVSFGILGEEEGCCGEPARRLGDEYNFQMLAETNVETMNGYNIKKIITACPHGYNTIKNEYPQFGGKYEVFHHTEILYQLMEESRIKAGTAMNVKAVYHDSCYLGRYNDIYNEPRKILRNIPGTKLTEMDKSYNRSFCCGAGGGRMWMDEHSELKVNQMRAQQADNTGADHLVSACPFCLSMLEDGLKGKNLDEKIIALDIAEFLDKSVN
ncbi:MAG: (Fe-S)-binding protein [candidate division Zixibacteria bacterium]|nr:(Fe-S)-binding protein [candidate division Zixibacteria bacterium]